ncbi:MAG: hypothetical protein Q9170_005301 [Blastenia crenularia]
MAQVICRCRGQEKRLSAVCLRKARGQQRDLRNTRCRLFAAQITVFRRLTKILPIAEQKCKFLDYEEKPTVLPQPHLQPAPITNIGSATHANLAGSAKPNAVARGQYANIVRTSRSAVFTRTASVIERKVMDYKELLYDLSDRVDEADQLLIQKLLEKGIQDATTGHEESVNQVDGHIDQTPDGVGTSDLFTEHRATGRAGSTDSLDCINEDFNRSATSRSAGFMGKNSEIAWMERLLLQTDTGDGDDDEGSKLPMNFGSGLDQSYEDGAQESKKNRLLSDSNYHCDDVAFLVHDNVQAYELPPRGTADSLLACYIERVHPFFPILGKTTFLKQYQAFFDNPKLNTGPRWLAVLNLIFALGARYSQLVRARWRGLADEHHVYFSRAWLLGLDVDLIWAHTELQRIQITGLASFYLMATHQVNR